MKSERRALKLSHETGVPIQHVMSRGYTADWYSLSTGRQDVGIDASYRSAPRQIRMSDETLHAHAFEIYHLILPA